MSADALAALQAYVDRTAGPPSRANVRAILAELDTAKAELPYLRNTIEAQGAELCSLRDELQETSADATDARVSLVTATYRAADANIRTIWLGLATIFLVIPLSAYAGALIHWPAMFTVHV